MQHRIISAASDKGLHGLLEGLARLLERRGVLVYITVVGVLLGDGCRNLIQFIGGFRIGTALSIAPRRATSLFWLPRSRSGVVLRRCRLLVGSLLELGSPVSPHGVEARSINWRGSVAFWVD